MLLTWPFSQADAYQNMPDLLVGMRGRRTVGCGLREVQAQGGGRGGGGS